MEEALKIGDSIIYNENCIDVMRKMGEEGIKVDLTVTSPPYDSLRTYNNSSTWDFDVFKQIAQGLYNITADGGIVVWVVSDATIDGSESWHFFQTSPIFYGYWF